MEGWLRCRSPSAPCIVRQRIGAAKARVDAMRQRREIDHAGLDLALAVADARSIRQAAREIGASAPVISRKIRALEDGLGVSLFERTNAGVRLTTAGADLLAHVRRLRSELGAAINQARDAGTAEVGRLVIGTYFSMSAGRLRDAVLQFVREHPGVGFGLLDRSRAELLGAVTRGRADLAVLLNAGDVSGLERLMVARESVFVAVREGDPLAELPLVPWSGLHRATFLVPRLGAGPELLAKIKAWLPKDHSAHFSEQDIGREAVFNLVGAGLGVAVLAASASGASYPGVVLRPVGDEAGPTMVDAAAYWDPKRDNPALRRFLALLRATQGSRKG